MTNVSP
jgi:hypothetical protein